MALRLQDFRRATELVDEHRQLASRLAAVKVITGSSISIVGQYQDAEMTAVLKPHIVVELQRRLDLVEGQLNELGIVA
jgi:hypothetical protein